MGAVLGFFIVVVGMCTWGGAKLIARGMRASARPPIPPARMANPEGMDRAYAKAANVAAKAPRKVAKAVLVSAGVGLIAAPWIFVYTVLSGLKDLGGGSKGRVLRIRGRARLPELATGDGWGERPVAIEAPLSAHERGVLGELWLTTARMEHASIAAFSQLSLHLSALAAPARLLEATHRAALDEIRHAQACFAVVRAITGVPHTAGPIAALGSSGSSAIDHVRLAVGSIVDGCLAEGIAADVAAHGAARATEPVVRETLAMIAREELTHAELAWDVLAWCLDAGGDRVHAAVAARAAELTRELSPSMPPIAGIADATLVRFGVIDQDTLGTIASTRIAAVQTRATAMLAAPARAAA